MTSVSVLVADCPWGFRDNLPGRGRGARKHYRCLTVEQLCALDIPTRGDANSVLFLWRVASMQAEALRVCAAWGYEPKSEIVWEKTTATGKAHFGMGHYVRASHEVCLIAVRGSARPAVRNIRSRFSAPVGVHSQKPDAFYTLVRAMYPHARKYELFARTVRRDFTQVHSNELGKLGEERQAV